MAWRNPFSRSAPYPSNATVRPPAFYDPSGQARPDQRAVAPAIAETTTPILPPFGGQEAMPTDWSLNAGMPPTRVPRLYPTREPAGVQFAANRDAQGQLLGDQVYLPLPAIPKTTATSTRMRGAVPIFADNAHVSALFVGGRQQ